MRDLVQEIVEASKKGPLYMNGSAQRWAGPAYDDGEGGVVWIDLGLWNEDMVSNHPMHWLGRPVAGWGDHWVCQRLSEYAPAFLAPRWHHQIDRAWQIWRTMPAGWRATGLRHCQSISPRARD
ncbi:hypothetical protein [Geminicoccus roseus]|uniref:hypothetical protein n=1 Tax=Geminicoccus roseus TaxID=404900 RepID=UPI00042979D5|nr:hypothetical protein [Geminicoccus roseus]